MSQLPSAVLQKMILGAAEQVATPGTPRGTLLAGILTLALSIILLTVIVRFTLPWALEHWHNSRWRLFGTLCRAHRLGWQQRQLLKAIARQMGLPHPVNVFLEPDKFRALTAQPEWESQHERLMRLASELFAAKSRP